ncbi:MULTISPECIES: helix-turn-helix transcriptional regulator [Bradyrhizobium]|uniref:helix-turn-helix transcriptional regulator n=1 Tax=Bradyrhizobium centrosematis TaxID=1300039 RepID=UPI00216969CC|nr:helix-turn-helix transcriptional regulator [Bradyrhizobium centrosematis]MCS3765517.1 DNA-binding CsgD family transcriptional regulator [Bradyrhizobium centrosematis]MCS3778051.1 DNA-binding CsgD family transcriptional regulator [Bradyrhizobium centrosematis]
MSAHLEGSVIVPWDEASADPRAQLLDRTIEATRLIRDLVRCSAFTLTAWDPLAQTHRHQTLASDGYSDKLLEHINDDFVKNNPAFTIAHRDDPRSLRWRDCEQDWNLWFPDTLTAREFLIPSGFHEGSTMCLRLSDGRYVGAFHMNWTAAVAATDERREITQRFRPILAELCDRLRTPRLIAEGVAPDSFALVISSSGAAFDLLSRSPGPHLGEDGALRRLLLDRLRPWTPRRFLWSDDTGRCHRVSIIPCQRNMVLVTEEQIPWPYDLSFREVQVLHLVATGASNPQIAEQLFVSPRTVSTHIEHILAKMDCVSRAQLAARTMSEGLLLAQTPSKNAHGRDVWETASSA